MKGIREGLSSKLRRDAPHLLDVHWITHREPLATNDASSHFVDLQYIDKFANKFIHGLENLLKNMENW